MSNEVFYQVKKKGRNRPKPKRQSTARRRSVPWRIFMFLTKLVLWLIILGALGGTTVFVYFAKDLPDPGKINQRQIVESTKIYDRTGQALLYDIHGEEKRTVVPFDQISQYLKDATVVIEDTDFYRHPGLDLRGIARALVYNLLGRRISQGGSTITQQFIKNSILTPERTLTRKIKEAVLSLEMERKYSKDEILGFYLNQISYGSNAYGIEAAAQTFFGKSAKDLDLAESALLAALPKSPSRLSPFGSHPEELKGRQEYILDRLAHFDYISPEQAETAKEEKLNFSKTRQAIKAPHFVMYVKEYLEEKYGQEYVERAGLKVYTSLDWDLQQTAQQIIEEGAKNNQKKYGAFNAALAALDPKTGQILALVGSKNYFDDPLPENCEPGKNCRFEPNVNVAVRDRQPGSSFKPFAYVTAFKKSYTDQTILFDLKTEFNPNCSADGNQEKDQFGLGCYHPDNYDGAFRGPVTARQALAQSLNVPSVQMLYLAGVPDTIETAKEMGITTLNDPSRYGLSLVLGGGEVKLLDEVAAYGVFAAEGVKYEKTAILKIEDNGGRVVEEFKGKPQKILEPALARLITSVLSDNTARSPVFGSSSALYFSDRPVAAKTGTTQGYRDAWTLGYTPSLVAGVWVGNNDNSPMARAGAGLAAAGPLWRDFLQKAYELKSTGCATVSSSPQIAKGSPGNPFEERPLLNQVKNSQNEFCLPREPEQFSQPEITTTTKAMLNGSFVTEKAVKVDRISGLLATEQTPPDLVQEKKFLEIHSILYYVQKNTPQGEPPADPTADPQFKNWETTLQGWLAQQNNPVYNQLPPTQFDNLHTTANLPKVKIIWPSNNQTISQSNFILQVEASAPLGLKQIDYFLDDEFIGTSQVSPYQLRVSLPTDFPNGSIVLRARAYDTALNRQQDQITITVNR